jgi:hypothetical protein
LKQSYFSCDTHWDGPLRHEMALDKELYQNKGLHHPPKHISFKPGFCQVDLWSLQTNNSPTKVEDKKNNGIRGIIFSTNVNMCINYYLKYN